MKAPRETGSFVARCFNGKAEPAYGGRLTDAYLDLQLLRGGKVQGEARAAGHENDILVEAFEWGMGAPADAVAGQKGRRSYRKLVVFKRLDTASTALMSAVAANDGVRSATLCMRKAGGEQLDYFLLSVGDASVVSVDLETDHEGEPVEKVCIAYRSIKIEYRAQDSRGPLGGRCVFEDFLR